MKKSEPPSARRMHPASVVFFIFKSVKDLIYPMAAVLISTIARGEINPLYIAGGALLFTAATVTLGLLRWYRFTYAIERGVLQVDEGLFVRKRLSVSKERVQSLDMSAGIVHRLFGLVKLQVETAGGAKPEVVLSAIDRTEAERIRRALYAAPAAQDAADEPADGAPAETGANAASAARDGRPTMRLGLPAILLYSATSGRAAIVIAAVGALYSQLDQWLDSLFISWSAELSGLNGAQIALLAAAVLAGAWLIGTLLTAVKEYGFTLRLEDDKLVSERGLLERRQMSVRLGRIQAVHIKENAVRRLLGYASVHIITAGAADKHSQSFLLCPLIRRGELQPLLDRFVPGYALPAGMSAPPTRAAGPYMLAPTLAAAVPAAPCVIWIPHGYGWLALLLPLLAAGWTFLMFRRSAWAIDGDRLALRGGAAGVSLTLVPQRRAQWGGLNVSPLQARRRLCTFRVALASSPWPTVLRLRHIAPETGESLLHWLSRSEREARPPAP